MNWFDKLFGADAEKTKAGEGKKMNPKKKVQLSQIVCWHE